MPSFEDSPFPPEVMIPDWDRRHSIRLRGHDYSSAGAYFVTICSHERASLFGSIISGCMRPSQEGLIVVEEWLRSSLVRDEILLDSYAVMPDHVHGIVVIRRIPRSGDVTAEWHGRATCGSAGSLPPSDAAPSLSKHRSLPPDSERHSLEFQGLGPVGATGRSLALEPVGRRPLPRGPAPSSLSAMVAGFKAASSRRIRAMRGNRDSPVWQRGYYEHVIRSDRSLARIRSYVVMNPARWERDPRDESLRRYLKEQAEAGDLPVAPTRP